MADGTTFLAIAFIAMIGIIGGWTWKMLQRLNELSERLAAAEATYGHAEEAGPAESSDSSEEG